MGSDKARLPFPDRWPMAVHVAGILGATCARVALVRRGPPDGLPWIARDGRLLEVVRDADGATPHPLTGLATACAAARTPWLAVLPCDVPFLPEEALERLVEAAVAAAGGDWASTDPADPDAVLSTAAIAWDGARPHPLVGVFPRAVGRLAARAAAEGRSAVAFTRRARRVVLPDAWLRNVNTWGDTGHVRDVLVDLAPWVEGASRERLEAGERRRLQQRGALLPDASPRGARR